MLPRDSLRNVVKLRPFFTPEPPKPSGLEVLSYTGGTRLPLYSQETHNEILVPEIPTGLSLLTQFLCSELVPHIIKRNGKSRGDGVHGLKPRFVFSREQAKA